MSIEFTAFHRKMFQSAVVCLLVYGMCISSACSGLAAGPMIRVESGEILVNSGQGFRAVPNGSALVPGSQLLAAPNTIASVVYPDGTIVPVQPGAMIYVGETAGSSTSAAAVTGWQTAVVSGSEEVPVAGTAPGGASSSTLLMIAGVGAAAGGIVALASGGGSSPASP